MATTLATRETQIKHLFEKSWTCRVTCGTNGTYVRSNTGSNTGPKGPVGGGWEGSKAMATAYAAPMGATIRHGRDSIHGSTRVGGERGQGRGVLAPSSRTQARPCREHVGGSLRFTRRARLLVLVLVAAAVVVLGPWRAIASAPEGAAPTGWSTVVVQPGDTLWTLAERLDPAADPRVIVTEIKHANALASSAITPGQVLSVPTAG